MRFPNILKVLSKKTSEDSNDNNKNNTTCTNYPGTTKHGNNNHAARDHKSRDHVTSSHHRHGDHPAITTSPPWTKYTQSHHMNSNNSRTSSVVEEYTLTDMQNDNYDMQDSAGHQAGKCQSGCYNGNQPVPSARPPSAISWWENIAMDMSSAKVEPINHTRDAVAHVPSPGQARQQLNVGPLVSSRGDIKVFLSYKKSDDRNRRSSTLSGHDIRRDRSMVHDGDPVFRQIFDMFDKNGDNVINVEELSGILEILGYSPTTDEVRTILERFDQDNSGTIDFDEYLILIQHWIEQDEEQIYEAFKVFDKDGDGFVSAQELKRALTQYGEQFTEEEANEFFNMMDTDGDGVINYEEFVEYLRSMQKYSTE